VRRRCHGDNPGWRTSSQYIKQARCQQKWSHMIKRPCHFDTINTQLMRGVVSTRIVDEHVDMIIALLDGISDCTYFGL
jgi:hypothetical protein